MYSLHPITTELVMEFLAAVETGSGNPDIARARKGMEWMNAGDSRGADVVSHALATFLTARGPAFAMVDVSLSGWEASIDRAVGMLMRPPSRIFVDAGMSRARAQDFPIRIDQQRGMMAGAYVPPHLIPDLHDLLQSKLDRQLRRLQEAEMEPVLTLGTMLQAVGYAREHQTGLLEAMDVLHPEIDAFQIIQVNKRKDLDPHLRERLEEAIKPPKRRSLVSRLLGRSESDDRASFESDSPGDPFDPRDRFSR